MAKRELAKRGYGITLGATTLLHEAYLEISGREGARFPDRPRFMAYSSRVMRGLIIDYARSRYAQKRGGQFEITSIKTEVVDAVPDTRELSRISEALDALSTVDPDLATVVDRKAASRSTSRSMPRTSACRSLRNRPRAAAALAAATPAAGETPAAVAAGRPARLHLHRPSIRGTPISCRRLGRSCRWPRTRSSINRAMPSRDSAPPPMRPWPAIRPTPTPRRIRC